VSAVAPGAEPVERAWHDTVAVLRLARPPVNALSPELVASTRTAIASATEAGAGAIVVTGLPGIFSAGLDLPRLLELDAGSLRAFWEDLFGLLEDLARSPVPVVAALSGHSAAGGTILALFCDYRITAAGDFRIGLNEVQAGLVVPGAIRGALARLVGPYRAERHLLAGELVAPAEAERIGLVDELVRPDELLEGALAWCRHHLALPQHAFAENRRLLRSDLAALFDHADNLDVDAFAEHWQRPETRRALEALVAGFRDQ
jgi:enoyl-CoA hydratase/carnithine racemase